MHAAHFRGLRATRSVALVAAGSGTLAQPQHAPSAAGAPGCGGTRVRPMARRRRQLLGTIGAAGIGAAGASRCGRAFSFARTSALGAGPAARARRQASDAARRRWQGWIWGCRYIHGWGRAASRVVTSRRRPSLLMGKRVPRCDSCERGEDGVCRTAELRPEETGRMAALRGCCGIAAGARVGPRPVAMDEPLHPSTRRRVFFISFASKGNSRLRRLAPERLRQLAPVSMAMRLWAAFYSRRRGLKSGPQGLA